MAHSTYFEQPSQGDEKGFHILLYFIQLVKRQLSATGKVLWGMTDFVLGQLTVRACWAGRWRSVIGKTVFSEHREPGCSCLGLLRDFMKNSALVGLILRIWAKARVPEDLGLLFRWQLYSTPLGSSTWGLNATANIREMAWLVFVNHILVNISKVEPGSIVTCFIC